MKARGGTTLLLTSIVLLLALILCLSGLKQTLHHDALLKARLQASQLFWFREGVLECIYAQLQTDNTMKIKDCQSEQVTIDVLSAAMGGFTIRVHDVYGETVKQVAPPLPTLSGVIQTRATLVFTEPAVFSPDVRVRLQPNQWKCTVIQYAAKLIAPALTTRHPYQLAEPPYADFPDSTAEAQRCHQDYHSVAVSAEQSALDYSFRDSLSPFSDFFGVAPTDWFRVMASAAFAHIPAHFDALLDGSLIYASASQLPDPVFNEHCVAEITAAIQRGKDLIWVYGGCEITDMGVNQINGAIAALPGDSGVILVVHNGLLAINSEHALHGAIVQFLSPDYDLAELHQWHRTGLASAVTAYRQQHSSGAPLSYFQTGSFYPAAGLILATPDTEAVISGPVNWHYQRDVIRLPLSRVRPGRWLAGSWYGE